MRLGYNRLDVLSVLHLPVTPSGASETLFIPLRQRPYGAKDMHIQAGTSSGSWRTIQLHTRRAVMGYARRHARRSLSVRASAKIGNYRPFQPELDYDASNL